MSGEWSNLAELPPEPAPAGIAPSPIEARDEDGPDLFSLLGGLAALTQEVRLEGRTLKRLEERLAPLEGLPDALECGFAAAGELPARLAAARLEGRAEMLPDLLDLRDRLARSLDASRARLRARRGLLARLAGDDGIIEGLVEGTAGVLERLDEVLCARDVHELRCAGRPFDPACMRAVDCAPAWNKAEGTVLEVLRPGYLLGERLLRPAEVKVVKNKEDLRRG